ncbi:MAG: substrate-binding domain-containing protein [Weeksellaceae bacterium]|jgi:phosphate transport system substrate-binding protein|nr:substrate-binding domain-containing protein [Weeksellaceae bacterium]MDX9705537.1 substrate-binding domain-containing protein [Weeksellaceae bacterium]
MEFLGCTELSRHYAQKIINFFLFGLLFFSFFSCNKGEEITHREGEMIIYVDPSNRNLLEALTEIYVLKFPKVSFQLIPEAENKILQKLLDTVAYAAFINQPLTEEQSQYIQQKSNVTPRSTLLAYDAALFIVNRNDERNTLSFDEIKNGILYDSLQIVFDNGNSGNFNTIIHKLNIEIPKESSVFALNGAQEVIEFVQKSKNSIGVIGLNEVSETDNSEVKEILKKIKVLSILDENGIEQEASISNILAMNYPFAKGVYFIVREPGFGIGSGFSRFSGSQQGQLIVKRAGLQPNYLYDREVKVNLKNVE